MLAYCTEPTLSLKVILRIFFGYMPICGKDDHIMKSVGTGCAGLNIVTPFELLLCVVQAM